jgi:hypothetical protein
MKLWSSEPWPGAVRAGRHRPAGRRIAGYFLTDLAVSIGIVLAGGRLFEASAGDAYLREAMVTQSDLYAAIGRFTPQNLFFNYLATIDTMGQGLAHGFNPTDGITLAAGRTLATIGELAVDVAIAGPYTLAELYRQTSGTAAWAVLAGYGMAIGAMLAWLFMTRVSRWRLLMASAVSPLAASVVFLVLQGFMVLIPEAFFWFTSLAPYTVACPVICTLYWIAFPNADCSATHAVVRGIGRVLDGWRG